MADDRPLYDRLERVGSVEGLELFAEWWLSGRTAPAAEFYAVLRLVWSSAEFPYRYDDVWPDLWSDTAATFERDAGRRAMLMTAEEMQTHAALPDEVTIHRGYGEWSSEHADPSVMWNGYSWTLARERAVWFAQRFARPHGEARLATTTIPRERIVALLDERNESEVIVLPEHVVGRVDLQRVELEPAR